MWITKPGRINKHLTFMGTYETCLYNVIANDALIVGGGMLHIVPLLAEQIAALNTKEIAPTKLIIQHSHADHCGAVHFLQKYYPGLEVIASAYASDLFKKEKVMQHIALSNKRAAVLMGVDVRCTEMGADFKCVSVDRAVQNGDIIDIGAGVEAQIIEVPGHTRCSIAVYIPAFKMLFPSDAVPVPAGRIRSLHYKPSPQYNYRLYHQSMERMMCLDFDIVALEHHGVFTGKLARKVMTEALKYTERMREYVLKLHAETEDVEITTGIYLDSIIKKGLLSFIEHDVALAAARAEVRSILRDEGCL